MSLPPDHCRPDAAPRRRPSRSGDDPLERGDEGHLQQHVIARLVTESLSGSRSYVVGRCGAEPPEEPRRAERAQAAAACADHRGALCRSGGASLTNGARHVTSALSIARQRLTPQSLVSPTGLESPGPAGRGPARLGPTHDASGPCRQRPARRPPRGRTDEASRSRAAGADRPGRRAGEPLFRVVGKRPAVAQLAHGLHSPADRRSVPRRAAGRLGAGCVRAR